MDLNLEKTRFYVKIFLHRALSDSISFDKAFSDLVRKYNISTREASILYKLLYKLTMYYHSMRFIVSYRGIGTKLGNIVEYLYSIGFDIDSVISEIDEISKNLTETMRLALRYGYPTWLVRDLYGKLPARDLEAMLKSLNEKKRWLRVNSLKSTPSDALRCLEETGVSVKKHESFEDVLLVDDPFLKIGNNKCIKEGLVIPEDIGSYLAIMISRSHVDRATELIDMCSAPGVKLQHLLSIMQIHRAIGIDLSEPRLEDTKRLLRIYHGDSYRTILVNSDSRRIVLNTRNPVIIIDAPCSNTGALYGDPFVKVRLSRKYVKRLSMIQRSLLANGTRYSGTIIYMTCSIHPLEGEEVIDYVLSKHGEKVRLMREHDVAHTGRGYDGYTCTHSVYRVFPHEARGQGFFIAVLKVS